MGCNELALSWKDHHGVLFNVFENLLAKKALVDCTLAAEGKILKAHRIVLCACSPYFETILNQEYDKHPIIFLRDVHFEDLKTLIEFVYSGEIKIPEDRLVDFLSLAEALQIKGLGGAGSEVPGKGTPSSVPRTKTSNSPVPRKRSRRQSNGSEENSSESNDSASAVLSEESNRTQHSGEDKNVRSNVPSVPSTSHVPQKVSEEVNVDISKVKKEISTSPVLNQSSCSEQLHTDNATDKNEEILGLKPEFAPVTFTQSYSDDLLPEDNNSVEPMLDQEQPSSSHQYSGFVGEPVDPAELPVPSVYPVGNIEQPPPEGRGAYIAPRCSSGPQDGQAEEVIKTVGSYAETSGFAGALGHDELRLPFRRRDHRSQNPYPQHGGKQQRGAKRFKCSLCPKQFDFSSHLQRHFLIHTGEKPFSCAHCSRRFSLKSNMEKHARTHGGTRIGFQCPGCCKFFINDQRRNAHQMICHLYPRNAPPPPPSALSPLRPPDV